MAVAMRERKKKIAAIQIRVVKGNCLRRRKIGPGPDAPLDPQHHPPKEWRRAEVLQRE